MIYFLKYFKGIAYFLTMLILFQSCVIYKKKPSTIEEATLKEHTYIKILTKDGHEHKFRWIEEKDGNVYTVKNTKRVFVKKSKIERYVINMPDPVTAPLDFAIKHKGNVYIKTGEGEGLADKDYRYKFIDIEDRGDFIRGIKMTGKDTATVIIPIEQIEEIKLMNKDLSRGVPILLSIFIIIGGFVWYGIANMTVPVFS
jgi:hypothetical protein